MIYKNQHYIIKILEKEFNYKFNTKIINKLLSKDKILINTPRLYGKTIHILLVSLLLGINESNKKIKIYCHSSSSLKKYNSLFKQSLDVLKIENYTYISNINYTVYTFNKNTKIEIETKIDFNTYFENCDYIFIDELYTIKYKTKINLQKLINKNNNIKLLTTLPIHCKKILKLFYKLEFDFMFIERKIDTSKIIYDDKFKNKLLGKIII